MPTVGGTASGAISEKDFISALAVTHSIARIRIVIASVADSAIRSAVVILKLRPSITFSSVYESAVYWADEAVELHPVI
jgi:hypothetical protein